MYLVLDCLLVLEFLTWKVLIFLSEINWAVRIKLALVAVWLEYEVVIALCSLTREALPLKYLIYGS